FFFFFILLTPFWCSSFSFLVIVGGVCEYVLYVLFVLRFCIVHSLCITVFSGGFVEIDGWGLILPLF
ncbi:hypothetical protein, partial [Escherichia coli]|uniref:hypothetical protein n=1 Tax=Escherichia coli TaxID=562 RepID=UPI001BAFA3D2